MQDPGLSAGREGPTRQPEDVKILQNNYYWKNRIHQPEVVPAPWGTCAAREGPGCPEIQHGGCTVDEPAVTTTARRSRTRAHHRGLPSGRSPCPR